MNRSTRTYVRFQCEERLQVHPIRDMDHRILVGRNLRPDVTFVRRCDPSMHLADAVVMARSVQRERRHVDSIVLAVVCKLEESGGIERDG